MTTVVFVAPFLMDATVRFVSAAASLPGVRLGLVTQDKRVPDSLKGKIAGHYAIDNGLDPAQIASATQLLGKALGGGLPDRLIGSLEQLQVPLAQVRAALGIEGLGVDAARNFRDKDRMKDVLQAAGLPTARHARVHDVAGALAFARQVGFPVVVKPVDGAGAKGTHKVEGERQLRALVRGTCVVEEFVQGREHSFDSVVIGGEPVFHSVSDYWPGPLTVVENPWIQWCVLLRRELQSAPIRDVGFAAVRALGLRTGLSHMEWFQRPDGSVAISEVGARPPGAQFTTLLSWAHDRDFYKAWAQVAVYGQFEPPERRYACGIAYLRGQGRGRVRAVHGLDRAQKELGPLVVEAKIPQVGQRHSDSYEGDGYAILRHPDTAVVAKALERTIQLVHVELSE